MRTLAPLSPEAAEDALVRLAGHLPAETVIGRPLLVALTDDGAVQVITDSGGWWWWVYPDRAERLVELREAVETTTYRDGRELDRVIDRTFDRR